MLLIIGLDGADWRILDPWLQAGALPTLAALKARGRWGGLASTMRPESSIAWTTFATGVNAGRHGVFGFVAQRPDSYQLSINTAASIRTPSFWQLAARAGKRIALLNVPMTYPPRAFANGAVVAGMLTPDVRNAFTQPPELRERLLAAVPDYVINVERGGGSLQDFIRATTRAIRARGRAALWLMQQDAWDAFVAVFTATDRLQHYTLHLLRPDHPRHHPAEARRLLPDLLAAYQAIDEAIARLLDAAGEDATTVILSDHGFSPVARAFYPNVWLQQQGLLTMRAAGAARPSLWRRLRRHAGLRRLKQRLPLLRDVRRRPPPAAWMQHIDWARTRAVYSPASGIRLNIRGREPQGVLPPNDADALADEIADSLLAVTDPVTGAHPIAAVFRREALYSGPWLEIAPDLIIDPQRSSPDPGHNNIIPRVLAPAAFADSGDKSGNHAHTGILLAAGPGIPAGTIADAHLMDMAPTIMHLLDLPVPAQMEGRVLPLAGASRPRISGDGWSAPEDMGQDFAEEDRRIIEERLRSLGYL